MEGSTFFHALAAFLILFEFTTHVNPCSAARAIPSTTSTEFIKSSCGTTTYPQLCYNSLSSYAAKIQTSPKLLANTALSVTLETTRSTSAMIQKLSESPGLSPIEAAALRDCVEEMGDSVDELQKSIREMNRTGGSNGGLQMDDIQTWVSAALTDEDTCLDGFAENSINGNVKTQVQTHITKVAHMTSNALALANYYASVQSSSP